MITLHRLFSNYYCLATLKTTKSDILVYWDFNSLILKKEQFSYIREWDLVMANALAWNQIGLLVTWWQSSWGDITHTLFGTPMRDVSTLWNPSTRKSAKMYYFTRTDCSSTGFAVFVLTVCAIFSSQVDANLLDPRLIMQELRTFADHALGVDDLQVRYTSILRQCVSQISRNVHNTHLQVPLKYLLTLSCVQMNR